MAARNINKDGNECAMQPTKPRIKPVFKLAHEALGLHDPDTNVVIEQLEENMKLREMPIEQHIRRQSKKTLTRD